MREPVYNETLQLEIVVRRLEAIDHIVRVAHLLECHLTRILAAARTHGISGSRAETGGPPSTAHPWSGAA